MTEIAAATRVATAAVIMVISRILRCIHNHTIFIVMMRWIPTAVMMMTMRRYSGMWMSDGLIDGLICVRLMEMTRADLVPARMGLRGHHTLSSKRGNSEHQRYQRRKRRPPRPLHLPP